MSGELENLRLLGQKAHRLGHGHRRLARDDAAAAGMDGFIPKPFDARQLYETLRSFLPPEG